MISVVWILSFAISCPLLFGLNNTGKYGEKYSLYIDFTLLGVHHHSKVFF